MLRWLILEGLIVANTLLFMLAFNFVVETLAKNIGSTIVFVWQKHYEAKKDYLTELSKLDIADEGVVPGKKKYN